MSRATCTEAPADEAVLFCDAQGRLVTCSGGIELPAAEGIAACITLEGAPFLVTCDKNAGPGQAELVPCPACGAYGKRASFVTLAEPICRLGADAPVPPVSPADAPGAGEEPPDPPDAGAFDTPFEDEPLDDEPFEDEPFEDEPVEDEPDEPSDEDTGEDAPPDDAEDFSFDNGDLDALLDERPIGSEEDAEEEQIPDDEEPPPEEEWE